MPTTYAHDLFGQKAYAFLNPEIKQVIRKNKNLFRIGLHGPDILFYDIPNARVTGTGIAMHREAAAPFFEKRRKTVGISSWLCMPLSARQYLSSIRI